MPHELRDGSFAENRVGVERDQNVVLRFGNRVIQRRRFPAVRLREDADARTSAGREGVKVHRLNIGL
jgi:hypothetical protein